MVIYIMSAGAEENETLWCHIVLVHCFLYSAQLSGHNDLYSPEVSFHDFISGWGIGTSELELHTPIFQGVSETPVIDVSVIVH